MSSYQMTFRLRISSGSHNCFVLGLRGIQYVTRDMKIKTAPSQGLFLDMRYDKYFNKRKNAVDPLDMHSGEKSPASLRWNNSKRRRL